MLNEVSPTNKMKIKARVAGIWFDANCAQLVNIARCLCANPRSKVAKTCLKSYSQVWCSFYDDFCQLARQVAYQNHANFDPQRGARVSSLRSHVSRSIYAPTLSSPADCLLTSVGSAPQVARDSDDDADEQELLALMSRPFSVRTLSQLGVAHSVGFSNSTHAAERNLQCRLPHSAPCNGSGFIHSAPARINLSPVERAFDARAYPHFQSSGMVTPTFAPNPPPARRQLQQQVDWQQQPRITMPHSSQQQQPQQSRQQLPLQQQPEANKRHHRRPPPLAELPIVEAGEVATSVLQLPDCAGAETQPRNRGKARKSKARVKIAADCDGRDKLEVCPPGVASSANSEDNGGDDDDTAQSDAEKWPASETNDEDDAETDAIVRSAREIAQMANSMHEFTQGEGDLNTTQDMFTQAELLADKANELYKEVRCFSYKVPTGALKKQLLHQLDVIPIRVQELQFVVKSSTVGKPATFAKVDNIIKETKQIVAAAEKVVMAAMSCKQQYKLASESMHKRSRMLSPAYRGERGFELHEHQVTGRLGGARHAVAVGGGLGSEPDI